METLVNRPAKDATGLVKQFTHETPNIGCATHENPLMQEGVIYTVFDPVVETNIRTEENINRIVELYSNRRGKYVKWMSGLTKDSELAEDYVQTGFMKAVGAVGTFEPSKSRHTDSSAATESWIYSIMAKHFISEKRKERTERTRLGIRDRGEDTLLTVIDENHTHFDDAIFFNEILPEALNSLSKNGREIVILAHAGYSIPEIAELVGKSEVAVRLHKSRGHAQLRENQGIQDSRAR